MGECVREVSECVRVHLVVVRHHGSVHRDDMDGRVCEREDSVRVDLVVVRHHGSGNRHSLRTQVM